MRFGIKPWIIFLVLMAVLWLTACSLKRGDKSSDEPSLQAETADHSESIVSNDKSSNEPSLQEETAASYESTANDDKSSEKLSSVEETVAPSGSTTAETKPAVLTGEIVPLNDGKPVTEAFAFEADLNGDGKIEKAEVREGLYKDGSMGWEIYVDGSELGYSGSFRSFWAATDLPDEANFPKDAGCRMYLVSLDGKTVSIAICSSTETWVINVEISGGDWGMILCVKTRLRGEGKNIEDLIPLLTLEEYIDSGWKVRPRNGDVLDFDNDHTKERMIVQNSLRAWLYEEQIAVNYPFGNGNGKAFSALHTDTMMLYRYDQLYYVKEPNGGYFLRAEITFDGNKTIREYTIRKHAYDSLYEIEERKTD